MPYTCTYLLTYLIGNAEISANWRARDSLLHTACALSYMLLTYTIYSGVHKPLSAVQTTILILTTQYQSVIIRYGSAVTIYSECQNENQFVFDGKPSINMTLPESAFLENITCALDL